MSLTLLPRPLQTALQPRERYTIERQESGQWLLARENGQSVGVFLDWKDALQFIVDSPAPKPDLRMVKTTECQP